jgi:hypothetical protein
MRKVYPDGHVPGNLFIRTSMRMATTIECMSAPSPPQIYTWLISLVGHKKQYQKTEPEKTGTETE